MSDYFPSLNIHAKSLFAMVNFFFFHTWFFFSHQLTNQSVIVASFVFLSKEPCTWRQYVRFENNFVWRLDSLLAFKQCYHIFRVKGFSYELACLGLNAIIINWPALSVAWILSSSYICFSPLPTVRTSTQIVGWLM